MATSFLYWNIDKRKNFENEVARICNLPKIKPDILLLVEADKVDDNEIKKTTGLKRLVFPGFKETDLTPKFYSKLSPCEFQSLEIHDSSRLVFARLNRNKLPEIIIGGIHFPSKLEGNDSNTQAKYARQIAKDISDLETRKGITNSRVLLFGDFNMNPFDAGMIEPDAFNATLSSIEANNVNRTHWFREYEYFYNPMWSFLGDRDNKTGKPKLPGTYYYRKTLNSSLVYWNVFDKVIMRPTIIDEFDFKSIKIIDHNGIETLVKDNYRLLDEAYSDHLPLTFKLKF